MIFSKMSYSKHEQKPQADTKSIEIKLDVGKYCGCTLSILLIDSNSDET